MCDTPEQVATAYFAIRALVERHPLLDGAEELLRQRIEERETERAEGPHLRLVSGPGTQP